MGSIPSQGTKIPYGIWCGQDNIKIKNKTKNKQKKTLNETSRNL